MAGSLQPVRTELPHGVRQPSSALSPEPGLPAHWVGTSTHSQRPHHDDQRSITRPPTPDIDLSRTARRVQAPESPILLLLPAPPMTCITTATDDAHW